MNCGHLICEFLSETKRHRRDVGEPSQDKYSPSTEIECFISEPPPRGIAPRPYLPDGDEHLALQWLDKVDPVVLQEEINRMRLIRAARGLAKFVHGEKGNREKLVALVDSAIAQTGLGSGAPVVERDGATKRRERLKELGIVK